MCNALKIKRQKGKIQRNVIRAYSYGRQERINVGENNCLCVQKNKNLIMELIMKVQTETPGKVNIA